MWKVSVSPVTLAVVERVISRKLFLYFPLAGNLSFSFFFLSFSKEQTVKRIFTFLFKIRISNVCHVFLEPVIKWYNFYSRVIYTKVYYTLEFVENVKKICISYRSISFLKLTLYSFIKKLAEDSIFFFLFRFCFILNVIKI